VTALESNAPRRRGVTLLEMVIVVALAGLLATISYPAVSAGLETLRLASAGDAVGAFFNSALNRAERRQEAVEITVDLQQNTLDARSPAGYQKRLALPGGVRIAAVLPAALDGEDRVRRFLVLPGGTPPGVTVELANAKGAARRVRVDPVTGVPEVVREPAP
jgi:prepilin-type N-terminal cleavage/methylation domain-containing protein